ncbi:hypothetical protein EAF00_007447 [Botryotinia globosa]|nr:hypothetical protein EAF00_007447 [Botryotinia globosa]
MSRRLKKDDFINTAYWCSMKDDPFVIFTLADDEAIAFQKDNTMKTIPYDDKAKLNWRELGTFWDTKPKRFQYMAGKMMRAERMEERETGVKMKRTAMEMTKAFIDFLGFEGSLGFQGNRCSLDILNVYAVRSSYEEQLNNYQKRQQRLNERLKRANEAKKDVSTASKAVEDMKVSIKSLMEQINKEDAKIKKHKEGYEEEKREREKARKEQEKARKANEQKEARERKEAEEKSKAAAKEAKRVWDSLLTPEALRYKGNPKPDYEKRGKH